MSKQGILSIAYFMGELVWFFGFWGVFFFLFLSFAVTKLKWNYLGMEYIVFTWRYNHKELSCTIFVSVSNRLNIVCLFNQRLRKLLSY